jgi:hypothetical protein
MLPGFRFLFVAIVFSLSTLIFGVGAASLLRSAHEEFASLPTRHAQPATVFAQPVEVSRPTLAMLRLETPPPDQGRIERLAGPDATPPVVPPEPPSPAASTEPDLTKSDAVKADLNATDSAKLERAEPDPAKPDGIAAQPDKVATLATDTPAPDKPVTDKATETQTPAEISPRDDIVAPVEASRPAPQTDEAALAAPKPAAPAEATLATPEPAPAPKDAGAGSASSKIATLGGPPVTIEPQTAAQTETADSKRSATLTRRAQARHLLRRRRIARPRAVPMPKPVALGFFDSPPVSAAPSRQN